MTLADGKRHNSDTLSPATKEDCLAELDRVHYISNSIIGTLSLRLGIKSQRLSTRDIHENDAKSSAPL